MLKWVTEAAGSKEGEGHGCSKNDWSPCLPWRSKWRLASPGPVICQFPKHTWVRWSINPENGEGGDRGVSQRSSNIWKLPFKMKGNRSQRKYSECNQYWAFFMHHSWHLIGDLSSLSWALWTHFSYPPLITQMRETISSGCNGVVSSISKSSTTCTGNSDWKPDRLLWSSKDGGWWEE